MSRITSTDKLKVEDHPDKPWLADIFSIINDFFQQTIGVINGGLTFKENFRGVEHEYAFKFASTAITFPQKLSWPFNVPPRSYQLVFSTENDIPIMAVCQFDYKQDSEGTFVLINDVVKLTSGGGSTGLSAGDRYRFRVRITP